MLPLSDYFTRQGQSITTCTQICLFKSNLPPEYERIGPFHSVASGEKEEIMLPLSHHFTWQGVSLCELKYLYSKTIYLLRMSQQHHFTVWQVGKRRKSCYHYQITTIVLMWEPSIPRSHSVLKTRQGRLQAKLVAFKYEMQAVNRILTVDKIWIMRAQTHICMQPNMSIYTPPYLL